MNKHRHSRTHTPSRPDNLESKQSPIAEAQMIKHEAHLRDHDSQLHLHTPVRNKLLDLCQSMVKMYVERQNTTLGLSALKYGSRQAQEHCYITNVDLEQGEGLRKLTLLTNSWSSQRAMSGAAALRACSKQSFLSHPSSCMLSLCMAAQHEASQRGRNCLVFGLTMLS